MCDDFDLRHLDYFKDCDLPPPAEHEGPGKKMHWRDRLIMQGVPKDDVEFLTDLIQPDPRKRMTVDQILGTKYLDVD